MLITECTLSFFKIYIHCINFTNIKANPVLNTFIEDIILINNLANINHCTYLLAVVILAKMVANYIPESHHNILAINEKDVQIIKVCCSPFF